MNLVSKLFVMQESM